MGKTRLLQELMVEARARDYVVATARCYASEQGTAYYPFLEALSALTAGMSGRPGTEAQRHWKRIQRLIGEDAPDGGTVGASPVKQRDLGAAVSDLLQLVARSASVALLVDDLQWADDASLKLLHQLAYTTRSSPLLIAATFRDARLAEDHLSLAQSLQTRLSPKRGRSAPPSDVSL